MMNYNWFVGQRVMCVDGRFPGYIWEWCDAVPVAGLLYTIRREIFSRNHSSGVMCLSFHLEEIINPEVAGIGEAAFHFARFRPLEHSEVAQETLHEALTEPALALVGSSRQ
jgi:hypothetical protein